MKVVVTIFEFKFVGKNLKNAFGEYLRNNYIISLNDFFLNGRGATRIYINWNEYEIIILLKLCSGKKKIKEVKEVSFPKKTIYHENLHTRNGIFGSTTSWWHDKFNLIVIIHLIRCKKKTTSMTLSGKKVKREKEMDLFMVLKHMLTKLVH